jgi:hypothetical protein
MNRIVLTLHRAIGYGVLFLRQVRYDQNNEMHVGDAHSPFYIYAWHTEGGGEICSNFGNLKIRNHATI